MPSTIHLHHHGDVFAAAMFLPVCVVVLLSPGIEILKPSMESQFDTWEAKTPLGSLEFLFLSLSWSFENRLKSTVTGEKHLKGTNDSAQLEKNVSSLNGVG